MRGHAIGDPLSCRQFIFLAVAHSSSESPARILQPRSYLQESLLFWPLAWPYFPVGFDGWVCTLLHLQRQNLVFGNIYTRISEDKLWKQLLLKKVGAAPYWEKKLASVVRQFVVGF